MDFDAFKEKAKAYAGSEEWPELYQFALSFQEGRRLISELRSKRRAHETAEISPEERAPFVQLVKKLDDTPPESSEREHVMRLLDEALQNLCRGRSLISPITHESKELVAVGFEEAAIRIQEAKEDGEGSFDSVLRSLRTLQIIAEAKPRHGEAIVEARDQAEDHKTMEEACDSPDQTDVGEQAAELDDEERAALHQSEHEEIGDATEAEAARERDGE